MRGKEKPNDIDLCIIINEKDEEKSLDLIDSLGKLVDKNKEFKFQINILTEKQFLEGNTLTKTLIKEGFSIKKNKKLAKVWGFDNRSIFIYTLKNFSNSKRVKFHYLLQGRYGRKGLLEELEASWRKMRGSRRLSLYYLPNLLSKFTELWRMKSLDGNRNHKENPPSGRGPSNPECQSWRRHRSFS